MKSMTGFGIAEFSDQDFDIGIQIKSVNSRFFEARLSLPPEISFLELEIKNLIKERIKRGKIEVRINLTDKRDNLFVLNEKQLNNYYSVAKKIKEMLGLTSSITVDYLMNQENIIQINSPDLSEDVEQKIFEIIAKAISEHRKSALKEGSFMKIELMKLIDSMRNSLKNIGDVAHSFKKGIFNRLKMNIDQLIERKLDEKDYNRLMLETAIYSDKMDVNEEIIRLEHHLQEFLRKLDSDCVVGKSLNFLLQEIHREINTIGAKFNSVEAAPYILSIKEETEKCRELVQNVE